MKSRIAKPFEKGRSSYGEPDFYTEAELHEEHIIPPRDEY